MSNDIGRLVNAVFEKAKKVSRKDTKYGLSVYLEDIFREEYRVYENTSYKTLERAYEKYIDKTKLYKPDLKSPLKEVMAKYLGYDSYEIFLKETKGETKSPVKKKPGTERILLIVLGVILLGLFSYKQFFNTTEEKCMTWKEDHYINVSCGLSENPEATNEIILYDETIYIKFKKIPAKAVNVGKSYYYKEDGTLEYFSWYGLHPVTKEHLKPVTQYIYDKYVIPELEKE